MLRLVRKTRSLRGRLTALVTLWVFVIGNIGWPVMTNTAAGGQCCKVSGLATCCCGDKPGAKNCGCGKGAVIAQRQPSKAPSSCCQKRLDAARTATVVVACACGESSVPGFVVSTQPKIMFIAFLVAEMTVSGDVPAAAPLAVPRANQAPETPPPRTSVS